MSSPRERTLEGDSQSIHQLVGGLGTGPAEQPLRSSAQAATQRHTAPQRQAFTVPQLWRLEVQGQGDSRASFWRGLCLGLAEGTAPSHGLFSLFLCGELSGVSSSPERTNLTGSGPHPDDLS